MADEPEQKTLQDLFRVINDMRGEINERFEQVDARFEQMNARFEQVDARFEQVDARFEQVDARFEQVDARFDRVEARFDDQDLQLEAIRKVVDNDMARHADLVRVENKVGDVAVDVRELKGRVNNLSGQVSKIQSRLDRGGIPV